MSLLTDTSRATLAGAHSHGPQTAPEQSRAERTASYAVADFAVPTGREEEWRFTPVDRLGGLLDLREPAGSLPRQLTLPAGVTVEEVAADDPLRTAVPKPADRAAAAAYEQADGAFVVRVAPEASPVEPVRIRVHGEGGRAAGHLVIDAGRFSVATVILDYTGQATYGELVSVLAGDGAQLTVAVVGDWADGAVHVTEHDVVVGRDATVRHIAVSLGGSVVRMSTNTSYAGPGGSFEGYGVYFADAGQHLEHRLFVDHEAPHCRSYVEYEGALQGPTAHRVWVVDVLIRASAEGTDTYELNRNLLLTEGARADSVPNLEIETGEIAGAGHASATGRFDEQQLFYLQARGIPEDEARRLVLRGFFATIVAKIGVPEVIGHVMSAVERELASGTERELASSTERELASEVASA